jgi:hypothetical protein
MAAATIVSGTRRVSVIGSKRMVTMLMNINNTNTYVDNAIKLIQGLSIDSSAQTTAIGATFSGGTITFTTGGNLTNCPIIIMGY